MLNLDRAFAGRGGQRRVAEYLIKHGLRVSPDGLLRAGDVEVSQVSVARVLDVDRRVVKSTIGAVLRDRDLGKIFGSLSVTPSLRELAPVLGFGAVEIIPTNAAGKGIVAGVTSAISNAGVGIRQVIADDPVFADNPELTIITDKPIPRNLIDKILKVKGVRKVVVLN
ncbi:MAG: amino acid-binding protein [Candidatus Altiarchaeota archaeon]